MFNKIVLTLYSKYTKQEMFYIKDISARKEKYYKSYNFWYTKSKKKKQGPVKEGTERERSGVIQQIHLNIS